MFWHGHHFFEPRSNDENDTRTDTASPNFRTTPAGGHLATMDDLECNRPHTRRIFSGIGLRTWNTPAPRPYRFRWHLDLKKQLRFRLLILEY
ncbi:hypothetical protein AVEN_243699-1 [Araneus ventricosus]|uniref:Uncharacterized protein n=1 Tax=Araneus ventricosus TaxID=182803 RepID=A0A4Y2A4R5_ARAVE|nr:hypothetical protein AVEN_243699-1 [Araneus ventricosus]